jgi:exopolysaccharide biosynthesis polyprenyl glycosylphosphotransferase
MVVFLLISLTGADSTAGAPLVLWTWLAALLGVTVNAMSLIALQRALRRRGHVERRALIVGADATGVDMAARLRRMPQYGLRAVGFLDPNRSIALDLPAGAPPLLGELDDLATVAAEHGVRNVIICFPEACHHATLELVATCDALGLETTVIPRLSAAVNSQTRFEYLGVQPLLNLRAVDREGWRFGLKHAVDRLLAALALVLLSPLMALLATLVRVTSPGPVLFRQQRTGRDGRVFELLKFRTMIEPDEAAIYALYPEFVPRGMAPGGVEGADRRTRVGRLLRRTSLDELPQLVNVLRGEMSLVGPRPERPEFADIFRLEIERYHERQRVRAGITGWAQVHGLRGQTPLSERVELDNFYIEHWSLALDVKIMLLTLPALLRGS